MIEIEYRASIIFDEMIRLGHIPISGQFEVTDRLRDLSFTLYRKFFPSRTGKKIKSSERKLAKKIAGLNMMRLNEKRFLEENSSLEKKTKVKYKHNCGFVYIIANEAFPDSYKIGITTDINRRLAAYQTCDPFRRFKVLHYRFVNNKSEIEKNILDKFQTDIIKGEWISNSKVRTILKSFE